MDNFLEYEGWKIGGYSEHSRVYRTEVGSEYVSYEQAVRIMAIPAGLLMAKVAYNDMFQRNV